MPKWINMPNETIKQERYGAHQPGLVTTWSTVVFFRLLVEIGLEERLAAVAERLVHPDRHLAIVVALRVFEPYQARVILRRAGAGVASNRNSSRWSVYGLYVRLNRSATS